ncbi:MAG: serine/threonine protein kinase [Myxococcota bacterium]
MSGPSDKLPCLLGEFWLVERLHESSRASVYLAYRERDDRLLVLKTIAPQVRDHHAISQALMRNALVASRIEHPHIERVFEASIQSGRLCVTAQFIFGITLEELNTSHPGRTLPVQASLSLVKQILGALTHVHELRIEGEDRDLVHGQLSPERLVLGFDGVARIVGFGDAAFDDDDRPYAVGYEAPERTLDRPLDRRSDLYAVGVMLWEMLAGRRLFGDAIGVSTGIEAPLVSTKNPELPASLDAIVAKALSSDPNARYLGAKSFLSDLEPAIRESGAMSQAELAAFLKVWLPEREAEMLERIRRALKPVAPAPKTVARIQLAQTSSTARKGPNKGAADKRTPTPAVSTRPSPRSFRRWGRTASGLSLAAVLAAMLHLFGMQLIADPTHGIGKTPSSPQAVTEEPVSGAASRDSVVVARVARGAKDASPSSGSDRSPETGPPGIEPDPSTSNPPRFSPPARTGRADPRSTLVGRRPSVPATSTGSVSALRNLLARYARSGDPAVASDLTERLSERRQTAPDDQKGCITPWLTRLGQADFEAREPTTWLFRAALACLLPD